MVFAKRKLPCFSSSIADVPRTASSCKHPHDIQATLVTGEGARVGCIPAMPLYRVPDRRTEIRDSQTYHCEVTFLKRLYESVFDTFIPSVWSSVKCDAPNRFSLSLIDHFREYYDILH